MSAISIACFIRVLSERQKGAILPTSDCAFVEGTKTLPDPTLILRLAAVTRWGLPHAPPPRLRKFLIFSE
jgi:hypothetical protein